MRSRNRRLVFAGFTLVAVGVAVACGDDGGGSTTENDNDAGGVPEIRADAQTNAHGPDASQTMAAMRLAHLAPEGMPVDFCYREAHAGTFVGPVLGGPAVAKADAGDADAEADADADADAGDADADAGDAGADVIDADAVDAEAGAPSPMLAFGAVTKYLVLEGAGPMTIAIVSAGATSCSNPLVRGDVTLDPGKLSTVSLFSRPGDGGALLDLAGFTDDRTTAADTARVRVIHAALGTATVPAAGVLAVRANAAKTTVLADHVEPHKIATANDAVDVDSLGYVTATPVPPPTTLAIGAAQTDAGVDAGFTPWVSAARDLALTGASLHTAFVLNGATPDTFQVLWCTDLTTDGDHTTCTWVR